jgi:hypothetical protein
MKRPRVFGVMSLAVVCTISVGTAQRGAPPPAAEQPAGNPQFEQLVDRYIAETGRVNRMAMMEAGGAGRGGGGGRGGGRGGGAGDDGSAATFERPIEAARVLLKDMQALDRKTLTFDQDIDYRYLESILKSTIMDGEQLKRWQQDPRTYLPVGLFMPRGGISIDHSRPTESGMRLMMSIRGLPARLENGKKNLVQHVAIWVEPSLVQIDGTLGVLENELPKLVPLLPEQAREMLTAEGRTAVTALRDFRRFLVDELPKRPVGDWRVGREVLNARLRDVYMVDLDADALYAWGRRGYAEQLAVLERAARKADPQRSWQQIERDNQLDHSTADQVIYDYLMVTRRARDWVVEKDLVSFPNGPADPIVNQLLTRLVYSKLGLDPRWSPAQREEYLRGRNLPLAWSVMTHEVYPGHGLVELWAGKNPRKLRQVETNSYTNQSWCYWVEFFLAPEFGFYPADRRAEVMVEMERNKLWRYARTIYEMGMHTGKVSFDEAVQLMHHGVLFSERDAYLEVEATSQGQVRGDAICTYGYHQFLQLRDDYFARMGSMGRDGSIKDFNDRVLKIGMLPMKLLREVMFRQLDGERTRPAGSGGGR